MPPARPQLKPALRRLWRDRTTVQLGVDPRAAVVVGGLDPPTARLLAEIDGTRERADLLAFARGCGLPARRVSALLAVLDGAGVLDDAAADRRPVAALTQDQRDRLGPDLAAASLAHAGRDGGAAVLARRRAATVMVHGAGRVGATVTTLLAAAGLGGVTAHDDRPAGPADVAPAGIAVDDLGAARGDAALRAARRLVPRLRGSPPGRRPLRPDVVVLCASETSLGDLPDRLVRRGVVHLYAQVRDVTGVVGPFVLPGRSSCGRCHDLHRADRDPTWPAVAAQLHDAGRPGTACDVVLATAVAAQAVTQVLAYVDGAVPPTVDGTVEIAQVDGRVRRRSWAVHPGCGCDWATASTMIT